MTDAILAAIYFSSSSKNAKINGAKNNSVDLNAKIKGSH